MQSTLVDSPAVATRDHVWTRPPRPHRYRKCLETDHSDRALRIAMLSWESLHSIAVGGVAAHVSELATALAVEGHEVHVFTRRMDYQAQYELIEGVHYHRCDYPHKPDFVDDTNAMCSAFVARAFATEERVGSFDVVHAHDWLAANAMIWIKQARGRRSILTIHSTEYGRCGNSIAGGQSSRIRFQEQAGVYWADHVIAVSRATAEEVCSLYGVPRWKVTAIHNAVRPERFRMSEAKATARFERCLEADVKAILFCGRLELQKGPDILLEAVPSVVRLHRKAQILFAGDGSMRYDLEERSKRLGLGSAVRFLGRLRGEELPMLYHACDAVCVPSRNEPFGIVVLEAWSAARPVVVTTIGGPAEYVDEGRDGLKVDPEPARIAEAIARLIGDDAGAAAMGRRGERKVRARFTWDAIASQTLAVYDPGRRPTVTEMLARPDAEAELG